MSTSLYRQSILSRAKQQVHIHASHYNSLYLLSLPTTQLEQERKNCVQIAIKSLNGAKDSLCNTCDSVKVLNPVWNKLSV